MKAHIRFNEFKKCNEESPKENGYYVVVQIDTDGSVFNVMRIHFTLENGWNTYIDYQDARIMFEERDNAYWGTVSADIQKEGESE